MDDTRVAARQLLSTHFLACVRSRNVGAVADLMERDPSLALVCDPEGHSGLMLAAKRGFLECLTLLLPHSQPNQTNARHLHALHLAAFHGHADCVRALLPVSDPFLLNDSEETPLVAAARLGFTESVRELLVAGDPHRQMPNGETALMAALSTASLDSAKALLPSVNWAIRTREGLTAFELTLRAATVSMDSPEGPIRLLRRPHPLVKKPLDDYLDCLDWLAALQPSAQAARQVLELQALGHHNPNSQDLLNPLERLPVDYAFPHCRARVEREILRAATPTRPPTDSLSPTCTAPLRSRSRRV